MDFITYMTTVFCLTDDWMQQQPRIRQRGPKPVLSDSEVLTIEVVGEFMGIDAEKKLYEHFCRYHGREFPRLASISRVTLVRQMANLWRVKERLWQFLLSQLDYDPALSIIDSFPLEVARFGRAYRARRLREWSAWGYDAVSDHVFFGMRVHLRVCWPGVIVGLALHPADLHDRWVADDMLPSSPGWLLADTNYASPLLTLTCRQQNVILLTPPKSPLPHPHPWPHWLIHARRRIETVIGQLVDRFSAKRLWAHDTWHLCSRWLRKLLSHTFAVFCAQQAGLSSLIRFAEVGT